MRQDSTNTEGATVWAAEHGASSPHIGQGDDASNAGHRWRIHGRLDDLMEEEGTPPSPGRLSSSAPTPLTEEDLRGLVARETEIDLQDVQIKVSRGEVTLQGTVAHQGESRALVELLQRQPGVVAVHDRLRAQID